MSITFTSTLLRENVVGVEKAMDWQIILTGTYVTGGFSITPANLGLDTIDFVAIMPDGSGANTNGVALVVPNLSTNLWLLYGTGAADTDAFDQIGNGNTITGFTFIARVYGVA